MWLGNVILEGTLGYTGLKLLFLELNDFKKAIDTIESKRVLVGVIGQKNIELRFKTLQILKNASNKCKPSRTGLQ